MNISQQFTVDTYAVANCKLHSHWKINLASHQIQIKAIDLIICILVPLNTMQILAH